MTLMFILRIDACLTNLRISPCMGSSVIFFYILSALKKWKGGRGECETNGALFVILLVVT